MFKKLTDTFKKHFAGSTKSDDEAIDEATREKLYLGAKSGNTDDQYHYAGFCLAGWGGPINIGHVEYWLNKAANQGHVCAQFALGEFYFHGGVLEKNLEKAKYWLVIAATNEHEEAKHYVENEI